MSSLAQTFTKDNDLMTRVIAGEVLIVPVRRGVGDLDSIYTLNEVGSRIWQLIDGCVPVDQIIQTISQEYEVNTEEAAQDVRELLESLSEAGLIHPAPEGRI